MPDRVNSQSPSEITAEHLNGGARPVMMTDHRDNRRCREDAIGETKSHDVLDCVLAEKVVDPEHLILVQRPQDLRIQRARRIKAMSERLFDHHPAPESAAAVLVLDR